MGRTRLRLSRRRKLLALLYGPPKASLDMFFQLLVEESFDFVIAEPAWLRLVALAKELLHDFVEFVVTERHLYFRWPLFSGTFASNRCVERRPERPVPHLL